MKESRLRLARVVAGRRSKFVAIGAWILLVAGLAPLAAKFDGAQKNEPSSFVPGNAESVEALEAAQAFPSGDATIATVVFLAGTFAVLAVLPLVALTQIGVTVAYGVLLDTFLVRSILVPAATIDLDKRIWWPSALARRVWAEPKWILRPHD
jgi:uncharacterized membrane protein YdfJ with MMPL/SSD domain